MVIEGVEEPTVMTLTVASIRVSDHEGNSAAIAMGENQRTQKRSPLYTHGYSNEVRLRRVPSPTKADLRSDQTNIYRRGGPFLLSTTISGNFPTLWTSRVGHSVCGRNIVYNTT